MSRTLARRCLLAAAVLGLLALPSAALANWPPAVTQPPRALDWIRTLDGHGQAKGGAAPPVFEGFRLPPRHGYEISVIGFGDDVAVRVVNKEKSADTTYVVRGTATAGRLEASLGELGTVSMRFQPAPHPDGAKRPSCHGHHGVLRNAGVYRGSFRFRGEGGYVSAEVKRAKGLTLALVPCRRAPARPTAASTLTQRAVHPTAESRFGPERSYFSAAWREGISSTRLVAFEGRKRDVFIAETETSRGGMAIVRSAFDSHPKPALTVSRALTAARVVPAGPFDGAGSYRAAPDGTKSWTGKLSVDFPGAPDFPLTGPQFKTEVGTGPRLLLLFPRPRLEPRWSWPARMPASRGSGLRSE